jgi:hypothetical protein
MMLLPKLRKGSRAASLSVAVFVCAGASALAAAQQSTVPTAPAQSIPRPDELEPGVNTTPQSAAPSESPAPRASPASREPTAPREPMAPRASQTAGSGARGTASQKTAAGAKPAGHDRPERLELETTDITGNRELPKVLYIVPWKRSDLGDLAGKPVNSLVDEVLQPLDRDVFQRENRYYDALKPEPTAVKAGAAQGAESKP